MPPDGLTLLRERLAMVPDAVADTLGRNPPDLAGIPASIPVIACGLGSSEAAARLLCHTLNKCGARPALFAPLASFHAGPVGPADSVLVVFTQGLSPNARIALTHHRHYLRVVLVTAVSPEGLEKADKPDRAAFLRALLAANGTLLRHPLDEEYTLLPRYVGPACVMITALQLASALGAALCNAPADLAQTMELAFNSPALGGTPVDTWVDSLLAGVDFNFANPLNDYSQNLAAKILESVYRRQPACRDLLQYAHGPFQINRLEPREQWIFLSNDPSEQALYEKVRPLFDEASGHRVITAPLPPPWDVFYHEAFLNRIVYETVVREGIDLINWPGKGDDGASYQLSEPHQTQEPRP